MTRRFGGFLVATDPAVSVPKAFFTDVLPQITDEAEIHATLGVFRLAADGGGIETPVSHTALLRDRPLRAALRRVGSPREPDRRIVAGLDLAVGRGSLLSFAAESDQERAVWYYVNTPVNQALVAAMTRGAVPPPVALWHDGELPAVTPERPNIFRLYEQNVGLLTPLIADHLVDALETYPIPWIEDAIGEAVAYNRRSWRYIQRILEKWSADGRDPELSPRESAGRDGTHETHRRRHPDYLNPDQFQYGRHLNQTRRG